MRTYFKIHMKSHKVFLFVLLLLLYPATGFSLENIFYSTDLNFHFYPPGARALGMGGAFVGLADDATAAASNPAGVAQLNRMQLAIEGRYVSFDERGKNFPYNVPGQTGTWHSSSEVDDSTNISFGAFTMPLFNNFLNISIFYDKPMDFSVNKSNVQRPAGAVGFFDYPSSADISIDELGVSIAKSFFDGRLMFGVGIAAQFFDFDSAQDLFIVIPPNRAVFQSFRIDESDTDVAYRVGVLAKPIDNLRIGASYTAMPEFKYTVEAVSFLTVPPTRFTIDSTFNVPDNLSMGAAYNIFPNWVFIFEARYIRYSELMDDFQNTFAYPGEGGIPSPVSDYSIDDVMEFHFGTEYVLNVIQNVPIALRAGFFYEPAHDLEYDGPNQIQRRLFDGGDDLWHYTFGAGAVFFNHFQVDVGADLTDESRNVALSMVYQF